MRKTIALLMVAGAMVLAMAAGVTALPTYITDTAGLGSATLDGFTLCTPSTPPGGAFTSGILSEGTLNVYSYEMAVSGGTLWDYAMVNTTNNPATGQAYQIKSFSVDYTLTGFPQSSFTNEASNLIGWSYVWAGVNGLTMDFSTTNTSDYLTGGACGQFNVETPASVSMQDLAGTGSNGHSFNGYVCGPQAVPEPISVILGFLGLASVAGFRRLRTKS